MHFVVGCLINAMHYHDKITLRKGKSKPSLREKCPNTDFFWSVFSCIRTEYGDLLRNSPYLVRIQKNTDQKNLRIWALFTH